MEQYQYHLRARLSNTDTTLRTRLSKSRLIPPTISTNLYINPFNAGTSWLPPCQNPAGAIKLQTVTQTDCVATLWFNTCPCIPDRIGIWQCWFYWGGENRSTRRKTSRSKGENQQQSQLTHDAGTGNRTQATLVGGDFPPCPTPASPNDHSFWFTLHNTGELSCKRIVENGFKLKVKNKRVALPCSPCR